MWLAEFDGSPAIIKQITGGADADARFIREVAALRLARRVRPFVVPGMLGTDPGGRVMVLEYLSELGRAPAPDWMTEYATALARLHAATGPDDTGALPPDRPEPGRRPRVHAPGGTARGRGSRPA